MSPSKESTMQEKAARKMRRRKTLWLIVTILIGSGSMAAANGRYATVRMLVAGDADPNIRTSKGETALKEARKYRHKDVATYLQQAGARE